MVIGGTGPVPTDRRWFNHLDQRRILILGGGPTMGEMPGTEVLVAPTDQPEAAWVLEQLAERSIGSVLLEGGPTTNAVFLAADRSTTVLDGQALLGTDAHR